MLIPRPLLPLAFVLALAPVQVLAQENPLTLSEAILNPRAYYPERLQGLQWIPNTGQWTHVKHDVLLRDEPGQRTEVPVATLAELNSTLPPVDSLRRFPRVQWTDARTFLFTVGGRTYAYDVQKKTSTLRIAVPPDAENQDADDAHGRIAFTRDGNLFIAWPGDSITQVTFDGADGIVNGQAVHREEYGISKGTFWSPDGSRLAFYRMDETMVTPYYVEDISTTPSTFKKFRYPMAGQTSHQVTLGIHDTRTGNTVFVKPEGPADQYLTNISWDPDNAHVHILLLDRATEHFKVERFDATTGQLVRTLFEERDEKWLEPQHPLTFLKRSPSRYVHWSQRDGWWHLYLYDVGRGLVRQLTQGPWSVKELIGTDQQERYLFVAGTGTVDPQDPAGAMETHLYRVELATGRTLRLTQEPGTHRGLLSADGRYLIDQWSSLTVPGRTDLLDASTGKLLRRIQESEDPMADVRTGSIEFVQVKGEHGAILNGRLIKPADFDPARKYPVHVYTYAGPHVQLVSNSYLSGASLWMLEAAERGYLVFSLDGHGTSNRGRDFEQVIHRQLGITEVKDQLHGVAYLKGLPYVDSTRMAVHGWSFGGHMTVALMLRAPEVFKAGVAGGAVQDWGLYEVMYAERYMDTPAENPEGYAATALPDSAANLRGDLLLIHDVMDDIVVPQHALRFLKSCVDKGVEPDLFQYPGHGHNVRGKDRVHLYTQVLDYIDEKLGK